MIDRVLAGIVKHIDDAQGQGKPLGYDIPRVDLYDGQVNQDQIAQLMQKVPAVFVAFQRATPEDEGDQTRWDLRLNLLVVTRNLATAMAAATGGPNGAVGAHAIAQHMARILWGQRLGLEIARIRPGAITTIVPGWMRGTKAALVGVELATAFWTDGAVDLAAHQLSEFLRVETRLSLGADGGAYVDMIETRSP